MAKFDQGGGCSCGLYRQCNCGSDPKIGFIDDGSGGYDIQRRLEAVAVPVSEFRIQIYMDDGRVFEYYVANEAKGREHASKIIKMGYRHSDGNDLEWYPPHRIDKVKVKNGAESTKYRDNVRAT